MKTKKTKKAYEEYINFNYAKIDYEILKEQFEYVMNKERTKPCRQVEFFNLLHKNKVGTLIRKYDSPQFEVGYRDWSRQ